MQIDIALPAAARSEGGEEGYGGRRGDRNVGQGGEIMRLFAPSESTEQPARGQAAAWRPARSEKRGATVHGGAVRWKRQSSRGDCSELRLHYAKWDITLGDLKRV